MIVIGSGPAGVACAQALSRQGHEVTILDVGREPSEEKRRKYAPLATEAPESWDPNLVETLRQEFRVGRDDLPPKPVLGSLHPYAPDDPSAPPTGSGIGMTASHGRGGLSAVWGAALLPYRQSDLRGWPIELDELAPFYRSVLEFLPLSARRDALAGEFPLYADEPRDLRPTAQIRSFLTNLELGAEALRKKDIVAGRARIAVRSSDDRSGRGCLYTGLCLHGCPLGAIWSSDQTLADLQERGKVRYLKDHYVERFNEDTGGVELIVRTSSGQETLRTNRVFVAAGALPTTRLVLRSLDAVGEPIHLRDSQYYTFALLRRRGGRVDVESQGNTLAQAFVELNAPGDPRRAAHVQIYGYSDLMLREVAATLRLPPPVVQQLAQPLLSRLLFCQGYLHSDRSRSIRVELEGNSPASPLSFSIQGSEERVRQDIEAVLGRIRGAAGALKALPLRPLLRIWEPGRGIHVGGGFPMSARPSGLETDLLGRPAGLRNVHLVDSSVFPSIPPTTITFTVMANAQRIASGLDDA